MRAYSLLVRGLLFAALPFAIYLGLNRFEPREVGLLLIAFLLLRTPGRALALMRSLGWGGVVAVSLLGIAVAAIWRSNDPVWVLAYPVIVSGIMLLVFAGSLLRPPSIVERIARVRMPDLPIEGVVYTRRVTLVWCAFFLINGLVAAWTAFIGSRESWLLYNGLISYLMMGALFAGEWLYRRKRFGVAACDEGSQ